MAEMVESDENVPNCISFVNVRTTGGVEDVCGVTGVSPVSRHGCGGRAKQRLPGRVRLKWGGVGGRRKEMGC